MIARWRWASLRWLRRHPWQLSLALVGIALGVAVVTAVDIATASATRAFEQSMAQITGDASHRIVGPPTGLDEGFYRRLRIAQGVRASAPVVEGFAQLRGETLRVLGLDPLADTGGAARLARVSGENRQRLLTGDDTALLAAVTARRHAIQPGDTVDLRVSGGRRSVTILGLIEAERRAPASLDGLAIVDIATAQAWYERLGRLDYIDLRLSPSQARALADRLPPGLRLEPAEARRRQARSMTRAFRSNLQAMGLLAVVVGVFLIYNTMTFSVVQRRRLLARLRGIGATRGQIFGQIIAEALALGAIATALGLVAGVVLAHGLVGLVTQTINNLYVTVTAGGVFIAPGDLAQAIAIGLVAALAGGLGPALEAAAAAPAAAGQRSVLEAKAKRAVPYLAAAGAVLLVTAAVLTAWPEGGVTAGFGALFALTIGAALLVPGALVLLVPGLARLMGVLGGPLGRIAGQGIGTALSRTALAVAALSVALAASLGMGVMIESFRTTVQQWLERTLAADFYLSAPDRVAARHFARLPSDLADRVRAVDGVAAVSTGWRVEVDGPRGPTPLMAMEPAPRSLDALRWKAGDAARARQRFRAGEAVLVTEPWAMRHDAGPGDTVTLRTDRGQHAFPIAGVYYDYNTDRGMVLMPRALYERWWHNRAYSSIGVFVAEGASRGAVGERLRGLAASTVEPLRLREAGAIRARSLAVFDQTFAITGVLRLLALAVAFVGVLTALLALQLERERELAILRATGATPRQAAAQVTGQTLAIALLAAVFAVPLGLAIAEMLVEVVNLRAFGWTIRSRIPPGVLAETVALALAAGALAGIAPAWRAARLEPASALRTE